MGLRVLLVDDSRLMRVLLSEAVRASGVPVEDLVEADDGEQALRALRQRQFDLVITDLHMPRLDGFELVAAIRRLDLPPIRIVILTSETGPGVRARLAPLPIFAHLTKPVTFDAIGRLVQEIWMLVRRERP